MHTACSLPHMGAGRGLCPKGSSNLSQIQPSLPISHLLKYCKKSQMHPKYIRNVSEIYPKFNLLSLDLSHSNTIKIKTSIHISSYITYIYPKFIPNSLVISHLLKYCKKSQMHPKFIG